MRTRCRPRAMVLAVLLNSVVAVTATGAADDASGPQNRAAEVEALLGRLRSTDATERRIAAVRLKNLSSAASIQQLEPGRFWLW